MWSTLISFIYCIDFVCPVILFHRWTGHRNARWRICPWCSGSSHRRRDVSIYQGTFVGFILFLSAQCSIFPHIQEAGDDCSNVSFSSRFCWWRGMSLNVTKRMRDGAMRRTKATRNQNHYHSVNVSIRVSTVETNVCCDSL